MAAEQEIHLTCRQCATQYRLDPAKLQDGRMVRCTACRAEWYQLPPGADGLVPEPLAGPPTPEPTQAAAVADWMIDDTPTGDDLTFRPKEKGEFFLEDDMRVSSDAVMPEMPFETGRKTAALPAAAIVHQPMGLGAGAYGVFIFVLLFCVTLSPLLLMRTHIVSRYPAMLALYGLMGVGVETPGQGLSFSSLSAENRIDKDAHALAIDVKLSNVSDHDLPYPAFRLTVRDAGGGAVKTWDFAPDRKTIKAGQTVPVTLSFRDPPAEAKSAELVVTAD